MVECGLAIRGSLNVLYFRVVGCPSIGWIPGSFDRIHCMVPEPSLFDYFDNLENGNLLCWIMSVREQVRTICRETAKPKVSSDIVLQLPQFVGVLDVIHLIHVQIFFCGA